MVIPGTVTTLSFIDYRPSSCVTGPHRRECVTGPKLIVSRQMQRPVTDSCL